MTTPAKSYRRADKLNDCDNHDDKLGTNALILSQSNMPLVANLNVHQDTISIEPALFSSKFVEASGLHDGDLVEIFPKLENTEVHDFANRPEQSRKTSTHRFKKQIIDKSDESVSRSPLDLNAFTSKSSSEPFLCLVKTVTLELSSKIRVEDVSINKQIANMFDLSSASQVSIRRVGEADRASSHVEISFRDAYLSRADMWRFTSQELVGKAVYSGQKISFLGSMKATIHDIHAGGKHLKSAYFDSKTVPVFRSEAARYVIFVQMSREMWDFDSEGDGEILFNRIVNGFLPELFKRWSAQELRHLVSIVMFARLEYRHQFSEEQTSSRGLGFGSTLRKASSPNHQDFYRVVVTDMASAQWTTILEELKKGFRVFLRDVSLFRNIYEVKDDHEETEHEQATRIKGRLSGALKGNILEAINLAASQFSKDYIDRDLIRTGISTVVVTAGSGVFDVDRDLLKLTSETLTNNGIGIDIVCLSKMPLHSVPLFRYRLDGFKPRHDTFGTGATPSPSSTVPTSQASIPDLGASPAFSSYRRSSSYFARFPSAFSPRFAQHYGYGVPTWVDLSYWSPPVRNKQYRNKFAKKKSYDFTARDLYVPRVRMYELQMMGLMELGMSDISIPMLQNLNLLDEMKLKKWQSQLSDRQYSRSLSVSPEVSRTGRFANRGRYGNGQMPGSHARTDAQRTESMMENYDKNVFTTRIQKKTRRSVVEKPVAKKMEDILPAKKTDLPLEADYIKEKRSVVHVRNESASDTASVASTAKASIRPVRAPRNFSYGLKGLMPFRAGIAKAEVQLQNVKAHSLATPLADESSGDDTLRPSLQGKTSYFTSTNQAWKQESDSRPGTGYSSGDVSKPIKINTSSMATPGADSIAKRLWSQRQHARDADVDDSDVDSSENDISPIKAESEVSSITPGSLPKSKIPFVRNVNASNPLKRRTDPTLFGRWQHLYPRKPKSAKVKWRSLCTPASVPLTTEDFPNKNVFEEDYEATSHTISLDHKPRSDHIFEDVHSLFLELISLRLSHGYQFVTGDNLRAIFGESVSDCQAVCLPDAIGRPRLTVVLAMGHTIQMLERQSEYGVKVTKYARKQEDLSFAASGSISYTPYLRTILANDYFPRTIAFQGFAERYPWETADQYLSGNVEITSNPVDELRYWRARFVLLPVEPPLNTWRKNLQEENEEEIHLLGIRALTQIWQKNRYLSPEEKDIVAARKQDIRIRDENPLEVKMETYNASELIGMELERVANTDEHDNTQLLPEMQKLDSETPMAKIAQAMQGEHGIEIKNRRWHFKLHYNCFRGEEFTTWLLQNFRNITIREEAVQFGNELMNEGLFEHVSARHHFKDGHYFYSMKQQYRQTRPETNKSWFNMGKSDKSVPATPAADPGPKDFSPSTIRTRSGSNITQQLQGSVLTLNSFDKNRKTVALSRSIKIDVDPRKRSARGRQEVVNVHYDRFHNPENCYHIWLDWFNTTCKLVDDAIVSWTTTAEKYGLKLVEVPIAEAVEVPDSEPFRNPYQLKLCVEPPRPKSSSVFFNPVFSTPSFTPIYAPSAEKHIYQKAILRRWNFVLDLEATNEFPANVDIQYSWGRYEYQHTQFVHRSGIILAQIMDDGDIMLLANRLYNCRMSNKESQTRMLDPRREVGPQHLRPAVPPTTGSSMQASGIVGINLASPNTNVASSPRLYATNVGASPLVHPLLKVDPNHHPLPESSRQPVADVFGPKPNFSPTGLWNTLITPEQIKDELEKFCLDAERLTKFYAEVAETIALHERGQTTGSRKATGSSSSALLRPVREIGDIAGMPAFELPEAVTPSPSHAIRDMRRATVAFESLENIFERSNRTASRNGSLGSTGNDEGNGNARNTPMSPLRKATK